MVIDIICWVLIGILSFYLIRNVIAGSLLYPCAATIVRKWNETAHRSWRITGGYRNYYLFVLNPFWWTISSVMKEKEDAKTVKTVWKTMWRALKAYNDMRKFVKNTEKLMKN